MIKLRQRRSSFVVGAAFLAGACVCLAAGGHTEKPAPAPAPAVLTAMQDELGRSIDAMSKGDPPAYFISYTVADRQETYVSGSNGALLSSTDNRARWLEVQTRVGDYQLDDTHKVGDRPPSWTSPGTSAALDDDIPILRREIWRETDRQNRAASEALIKVKTSQQVQVQTTEGGAPEIESASVLFPCFPRFKKTEPPLPLTLRRKPVRMVLGSRDRFRSFGRAAPRPRAQGPANGPGRERRPR